MNALKTKRLAELFQAHPTDKATFLVGLCPKSIQKDSIPWILVCIKTPRIKIKSS